MVVVRLLVTALLIGTGTACQEANPQPAAAAGTAVAPLAVAPTAAAGAAVPAAPVCKHGSDNPACATEIDPKVAADHGPELAIAGDKFGAGVTLTEVVQIADLMDDPDKWVGKRVRVAGEVEDVCQMAGCWFSMKSNKPGQTMKFKVTDGVMVFPQSAKGRVAHAEGVVRKIVLDLEKTKKVLAHEAEEQNKPFDPATVTEPMTIVRLDGLGAVIAPKP